VRLRSGSFWSTGGDSPAPYTLPAPTSPPEDRLTLAEWRAEAWQMAQALGVILTLIMGRRRYGQPALGNGEPDPPTGRIGLAPARGRPRNPSERREPPFAQKFVPEIPPTRSDGAGPVGGRDYYNRGPVTRPRCGFRPGCAGRAEVVCPPHFGDQMVAVGGRDTSRRRSAPEAPMRLGGRRDALC